MAGKEAGRGTPRRSSRDVQAKIDEEQQRLGEAAADPRAPSSLVRVREALESRHSLVVARAAHLCREHHLEGCEEPLARAFRRFVDGGHKADPGCRAKLATLEALDYGESRDEELFLLATRVRQPEPAWGPPVDTAGGVRARGLLALARLGWPDLDLLVAERLFDGEPGVRQAALDALGHRGGRDGAALALFKMRLGDEEPPVTLAAMNALLVLAPPTGLAEVGALLGAPSDLRGETLRELAAVALGQSRLDGALDRLAAALDETVIARDRAPLLRGIGLHRSDRAIELLARVIAEGARADAEAALKALAVRRFEPLVTRRVREAAARSAVDLSAVLRECFPPE